jgi:hypothetical protein
VLQPATGGLQHGGVLQQAAAGGAQGQAAQLQLGTGPKDHLAHQAEGIGATGAGPQQQLQARAGLQHQQHPKRGQARCTTGLQGEFQGSGLSTHPQSHQGSLSPGIEVHGPVVGTGGGAQGLAQPGSGSRGAEALHAGRQQQFRQRVGARQHPGLEGRERRQVGEAPVLLAAAGQGGAGQGRQPGASEWRGSGSGQHQPTSTSVRASS